MKRVFLLFILLTHLSCQAQILEGNVSYDINSARTEAFDNIDYSFSPDLIASNFIDANYDTNMEAFGSAFLTGQTELKDRTICRFSTGIYGVRYNDDPYRAYYYTMDGRLSYVDKKNRLEYPHNVSTYNLKGKLISTALYISKYEQYIFDMNKELTTHWVSNNGYDKNGVLKWTRAYVE